MSYSSPVLLFFTFPFFLTKRFALSHSIKVQSRGKREINFSHGSKCKVRVGYVLVLLLKSFVFHHFVLAMIQSLESSGHNFIICSFPCLHYSFIPSSSFLTHSFFFQSFRSFLFVFNLIFFSHALIPFTPLFFCLSVPSFSSSPVLLFFNILSHSWSSFLHQFSRSFPFVISCVFRLLSLFNFQFSSLLLGRFAVFASSFRHLLFPFFHCSLYPCLLSFSSYFLSLHLRFFFSSFLISPLFFFFVS